MPDLLLSSVDYGGYVSIIKFILFLLLFFPWLWLVTWVYEDARAVGTREVFWTGIVFGAGAAGAVIWLLVPVFVIGILFYLIAVAATSFSYVSHRNSRVMEYDRILTAEHIKGLFASKQKRQDALKGMLFITANNNEVPPPEPKTPDFFGYKAASEMFADAIWRRASDVAFSPAPQEYQVIYNIDGTASKQSPMAREQMEFLIRFVKSLGDLDINEKRKPQKGKFRIFQDKKSTEWEVATAGSTAGEQMVLKHITQNDITRLSDIGLTPNQYEQLNALQQQKAGLFIVAGPKKSGVTTTFYALLRNHDAFINSVNTFERLPSAELPNVTQNVFALSDTGTTTFDKKLQAIIRMGPDIVGVAGCQDTETAQTICRAAKDDKLMYVTLEADSVIKALDKWINLVGDRKLAVGSLLGIGCQRLLRKLCEKCKQAYAPNKELLRKFNIPAEKAKVLYRAGKVLYDKRGKSTVCDNCQGTGFVGRAGLFEIIMIDDQMRRTIRQSKSLSEISTHFRGAKMLYLQEQALRRVVAGTTAINEMLRLFSRTKGQRTTRRKE